MWIQHSIAQRAANSVMASRRPNAHKLRRFLPFNSGHHSLSHKSLRGAHLAERFLIQASQCWNQAALVDEHGSIRYGELSLAARMVARQLQLSGDWCVGDRVGLLLNNSRAYLAAFYGVLLAGGVVVPLPPEIDEWRKQTIFEATACRAMIASPSRNGIPSIVPLSVDEGQAARMPDPPEDLAAIFYTSGSTGLPKGVMLSHANFLSNAEAIQSYLQIEAADRVLTLLPFFHAFGNSVLQSHLLRGATVILDGTMAYPESVVEAIDRHQVTSFSGVPDFFRLLLKHSRLGRSELPSLRYVSIAGGSLKPELLCDLAARIAPANVFVMYGQTEATARLSYLPPAKLLQKLGSIGQGIPGVTLEVVNDQGQAVNVGSLGEIRARGPGMMCGYWNDPEATRACLRDGWLYTGDLAVVDDEGDIYPQGRANTLCKIAGFRVHPAEVEDVLSRCFPQAESIAVPFETSACGTRLALFLTPTQVDSAINCDAVKTACQHHLARHLWPAYVEILDRWPLNSACKVDRKALSARAAEGCPL